ncbi:hypothetical protein Vau01_018420 [Virgisporangium aurantiacum]|uniref:DUF4190 domain-containing protein n=2 Tax=Virgisporangium aurantiacum TaxID=175570 RepID=A0A8J4DY69_9ACTN|nr:hypothetical protein Vau01_018420 [Virgisporangium aurantiacum]
MLPLGTRLTPGTRYRPRLPTAGLDLYPRAKTLAVASLVISLCGLFVCGFPALIGAIMGHVARKQIRQRVEGARQMVHRPVGVAPEDREGVFRILQPYLQKGSGVALAGVIIGWIAFVLWLAFWVPFAMGFFGAATES